MSRTRPPFKPGVRIVRRLAAVVILLLCAALWWTPSDVVALISDQKHVLLGRYSVSQVFLLFFLTPPLLWCAAVLLWRTRPNRQHTFRVIAVVISTVLGLIVVDVAGRMMRKARYVEGGRTHHWMPRAEVRDVGRRRPPNQVHEIVFTDEPKTKRTFPRTPPGFHAEPVKLTLTVDARGFRNTTELEQYDIVAMGDSFTEGFLVDDDESWPALLARRLGRPVYNMGVSGASPDVYLANFNAYGLELKPSIAVFLIYEGNDLQGPKRIDTSFRSTAARTIKTSPILLALKRLFIAYLGPINATGPLGANGDALAWLPVAVNTGGSSQQYIFERQRLMGLYVPPDRFERTGRWKQSVETFENIKRTCAENQTRLLLVYAPIKAHVVMPLVRDGLDAEKLRSFAALKGRRVPDAEIFEAELFDRLDAKQSVLEKFCKAQSIEFLSLTPVLQQATAAGEQMYFTYDDHWTPPGHAAVADAIATWLQANPQVPTSKE